MPQEIITPMTYFISVQYMNTERRQCNNL